MSKKFLFFLVFCCLILIKNSHADSRNIRTISDDEVRINSVKNAACLSTDSNGKIGATTCGGDTSLLVPYTGATNSLDLGNKAIKAGAGTFTSLKSGSSFSVDQSGAITTPSLYLTNDDIHSTSGNVYISGNISASNGSFATVNGGTLSGNNSGDQNISSLLKNDIVFVVDGGGDVISTGIKAPRRVPYACMITGWTLISADDVSGSIVIDIWKDTYSNYPPTNEDTITSAHEPAISSSTKNQDLDVADWSGRTVAEGDILRFNVDSVTSLKSVVLFLHTTRAVE